MPIYGYTCQDCQHHFEVIRTISQADHAPPCECCGSSRTSRKMGTAMAVFGSGANRRVVGGSSGCISCTSQSPSACSGCSSR